MGHDMKTGKRCKKREKVEFNPRFKRSGHSTPRIVIGSNLKKVMTQKKKQAKATICTMQYDWHVNQHQTPKVPSD